MVHCSSYWNTAFSTQTSLELLMLLDEKSHREHTLIFGGGIGKAYETIVV